MLKLFLRLFSYPPLVVVHGLGCLLGYIFYFGNKKFAARVKDSLSSAHIPEAEKSLNAFIRDNARESGKAILETFAIWFTPLAKAQNLVKASHGWEHVDAALAKGKGIIFLTPHLGCFEITALYYAKFHPVTVLYRPSRQAWFEPIVTEGRNRGMMRQTPTNLTGVRTLLKCLKKGEAIGILPDQVPKFGEGIWANFFDRPAYTMTLVGKLLESTGATVILAYGERLSWGRGYIINFEPLETTGSPEEINKGIESLIRRCPRQYLWSYNRFKKR